MLSAYCTMACTLTAVLGSLARKPCPAALPGSLAWQPCPAALPGSLARQPFPAFLPRSLSWQLCPAALPGSIDCLAALQKYYKFNNRPSRSLVWQNCKLFFGP
jgi:hypothetical protein